MKNQNTHWLFVVSIFFKALDGVIELVFGLILLFFTANQIRELLSKASSLFPLSIVSGWTRLLTASLTPQIAGFAEFYLISHGIIKLFLIYQLFRQKIWAFPIAIWIFIGFAVYQVYRYSVAPSAWLIVLTITDVIVIILTWFEYQRLKNLENVNKV